MIRVKKCICILLTVCVFLSLFGCSETPKVTDKTATPDTTASAVVDNTKPTDEPSEDGTVGDALWYEKIRLTGYVQGAFNVIETDECFYYTTKDGAYKYEKSTRKDIKIISENVLHLLLHDDFLYFNTNDAVKKYDLKSKTVENVWDKSMIQEGQRFLSVSDFQIIEGYLYIWTMGTYAIRVDMKTKKSEVFLDDFSFMAVDGNDCYYIDHADKTFSIYHMDCTTKETKLIRGGGVSTPSTDSLRYDALVMVGNDIYYSERKTKCIFKLNPDGDDELIVNESELKNANREISLIRGNYDTKLFYQIRHYGAAIRFYEYDTVTGEIKILFDEIDEEKVDGFCTATESMVFYENGTSDDEKVATVELKKSVTPKYNNWYEKVDFQKGSQVLEWSNVIVEKSGIFYYASKGGLYRYDVAKQEDKLIVQGYVKNILLYNDEIYYSTRYDIYKFDDKNETSSLIWKLSDFLDSFELYDEVFDFMIVDNCLYILTPYIAKAICYNMKTKEAEWMLKKSTYIDPFNYLYIHEGQCYYIPYRTFQIHRFDYDTNESVRLRGDGLSEYDENHILYDGLETANGELYYFRRVHNDLYKYNENGEDELIFKLSEESESSLKVLHSVHNDKLYFATWTGSVYTIYEYSGSGEPTVVFDNISSPAFELSQCSVTDSAIFWLGKTGEDSTKVCMKTR